MSQHQSYELIFDYTFDDNAQIEANHRGFLPNVKIKTDDGRTYAVNFWVFAVLSGYRGEAGAGADQDQTIY